MGGGGRKAIQWCGRLQQPCQCLVVELRAHRSTLQCPFASGLFHGPLIKDIALGSCSVLLWAMPGHSPAALLASLSTSCPVHRLVFRSTCVSNRKFPCPQLSPSTSCPPDQRTLSTPKVALSTIALSTDWPLSHLALSVCSLMPPRACKRSVRLANRL